MQSVLNVIANRARNRGTDLYTEATRYGQFSSMVPPMDAKLTPVDIRNLCRYPVASDPVWKLAQDLAAQAEDGSLADITGGATMYYALTMGKPPYWAESYEPTVIVAGQQFLKVRNFHDAVADNRSVV